MSKVDWSNKADSTHVDADTHCFYKKVDGKWMLHIGGERFASSSSLYNGEVDERNLIERPKQWSGPQDGLPPVNCDCEVDHGHGKYWDRVTIVAHHCDRAIYLDPIRKIHYIWGAAKDFRPLKTAEQLAAEQRETAIREIMDIADVDCRVTAAKLADAGFKREVV